MNWGVSLSSAKIRLVLFLSAFLLLPALLPAQSFRGSIRGKVTDPSGSVVAGAKVTAKNLNTGIAREALTADEGTYVLAELPAGDYTVTVNAGGFAEVAQNIVVNVGLDTTADFALLVEKQTQVITVHEEAPVVDTTRDVLGQVVDQRLVSELPLNGRDFGKLVALTPGTTVDPSGVAGAQASFGQFNINGNRDRSNNYTLDGTDNNDPFLNNSALNQVGIGGAPASLLPIDAIQEFNLQASFGAEYGRNSGSVVNIVTKSGSNRLHGSGFEFLRNSGMDARNYFNTESKKSVFQNNNFGASLGGPIIKDKTFFFGAYEGQRERVGSDFLLLVPTPTQIQEARAIAMPLNGGVINPGLDKILAFYPVSTTGQIADATRDTNNGDNFIVKVDHNFTASELLTGRYAFAQNSQVFPFGSPGGYGAGSRLPQFAQTSPTRVQVVSASLLSTLSATKINEVRFGYSRYRTSFSSVDANFNPQTALGLDFGTGKLGLPEFDFTNIENLGATGFSIPRGRTSGTYQILDNFTWLHGKHTFKFGGEFRRAVIDNFNDNLERGIFQFTAGVGLSPDPVVDSLADFYTAGNLDSNFCCSFATVDAGNTQRTTYNNGFSFFGQDDYRILSNLTLNLGLRWEYFGPMSEAHNLLSNLGQDGQLAMVGTDGLNGLYNRDLKDFAPRFGFAWSAVKDTVVRGGYGIYYDYVPQDLLIANYTTSAGVATNPIGPEPVLPMTFNPGALNGTSPGPIMSPTTVATGGPFNVFVTPRNFRSPYSQNWNLNVQQKLVQNASMEIGYVGGKGSRLVRLTDLNEPDANGNRANGGFQAIDQLAPSSSSTYHALQAIGRIQNVQRFSGFASYVWSKSLDYASDGIDFVPGAAFPQDPGNLAAEHGPSLFDARNRFTGALNYELPDWRSLKGFGKGWELNSIVSIQSGKPIPIANSTDTSGRYYYNQRPDVVPGVNPILPNWNPTTGYLNPLAFIQPAYGTFGNLGRDSIYGPGYRNWDFSLTKITKISERVGLQLRAEFFNILNHPNFALPSHTIIPGLIDNGSPGNPQIGPNPAAYVNGNIAQGLLPMAPITQTPDVAQTNPGLGGGGPRVIQLGAKFLF